MGVLSLEAFVGSIGCQAYAASREPIDTGRLITEVDQLVSGFLNNPPKKFAELSGKTRQNGGAALSLEATHWLLDETRAAVLPKNGVNQEVIERAETLKSLGLNVGILNIVRAQFDTDLAERVPQNSERRTTVTDSPISAEDMVREFVLRNPKVPIPALQADTEGSLISGWPDALPVPKNKNLAKMLSEILDEKRDELKSEDPQSLLVKLIDLCVEKELNEFSSQSSFATRGKNLINLGNVALYWAQYVDDIRRKGSQILSVPGKLDALQVKLLADR